ncbi:MAG: HEPN domain-containing protein [Infirmifilum sp.]
MKRNARAFLQLAKFSLKQSYYDMAAFNAEQAA